ncbi:transposase family protein [Streptomyces pseudovenezuelae]|nr:transposase family protein [Streptomyces pseudovenezuelae]
MDHDEISWQDVLFEGFEVLVTTPVHGMRGLVVRLAGRSGEGVCPSCGRVSARVHDRYERRLQDLPLAGHAAVAGSAPCPQCRQEVAGGAGGGGVLIAWRLHRFRAGSGSSAIPRRGVSSPFLIYGQLPMRKANYR